MPVCSYLVDFVFWQALYGRWCPTVMSTLSRLMSRFVRDNQQDTGVRLMPTCPHGFCRDAVVISVELRSITVEHTTADNQTWKIDINERNDLDRVLETLQQYEREAQEKRNTET